MGELTPRRGIYLPGGGSTGLIVPDEVADIDRLNENFRKIDSMLGSRVLPSASSYTDSYDGDLVYAEDTELLKLYSANAGKLVDPRVAGSNIFKGTKAQRDAFTNAKNGDHWQLTDGDQGEYQLIGADWVAIRMSATATRTSTALTISAGVYTNLSADAAWTPKLSEGITYDNGFVIQYAGRYRVWWSLMSPNGAGVNGLAGLMRSGETPGGTNIIGLAPIFNTGAVCGSGSADIDLVAGAKLLLYGYGNGTAITISPSMPTPSWGVARI